ncbi:MAG: CHASE2 domain-containing protein [bacterium]|nr:MAG: CHASE2 domain-containing protein [bacterium]
MFGRGSKARVYFIPLIIGTLVAVFLLLGQLEKFELVTVDLRYPFLTEHVSVPLVLVQIDQNSLKEIGVWPWPRSLYAHFLEKLDEDRAGALLVDVDFSSQGRDAEEDRIFIEAVRTGIPTYLAMHMESKVNEAGFRILNASIPFPELAAAAAGVGSIVFEVDDDGTVRRAPEVVIFGDMVYKPLGLEGALMFDPDIAYAPPAGAMIHITSDTVLRIPAISFIDVIDSRFPEGAFTDKVVLLGATSQDLRDFWRTPIGIIPGVYLHAAVIETILNDSWVVRNDTLSTLLMIFASSLILGAVLGRSNWKQGALTVTVYLVAISAGALLLLRFNVMLAVTPLYIIAIVQYPVQVALHARRTEEVLDLERRRTDALLKMSELEDAEETGQQAYVVPLVLLRQVLGLDTVRLFLLHGEDRDRWTEAAVIGDEAVLSEENYIREVIQSGELITTRGEDHAGAHVYIPLKTVRTAMGILFVAGPPDFRGTDSDLRLLLSYSTQTAYFLESQELAEQMKEEEKVRTNLARYLSPQIVDQVIDKKLEVHLGGDRKVVTVLFSDIRDFTTISETMPPDRLVAILNEYFNEMAGIIFRYQGSLDKYIGDAMVAVFGSLIELENPVFNAVQASTEMMKLMPTLNGRWAEKYGGFTMQIGIGISSGEVFLGNIGSHERMEFTVIGDTVNVASRFSGLARPGQVLLTEEAARKLEGLWELRELDSARVKGKSEAVRIFEAADSQ